MSQTPRHLKRCSPNQFGQGVVEYILLLVVVIGIASAVLYRVFTPVRAFTDFYIGQYIDCLLDQGELPGLLGDEQVQDCDYTAMTSGGLDGSGNVLTGQSGAEKQNASQSSSSSPNQNTRPGSNSNSVNGGRNETGNVENLSGNRGSRRLNLGRGTGADFQGQSFNDGKQLNLGNPEAASDGESDVSESGINSNIAASNASQIQRRRNRITRVRGLAGEFYGYESEKKGKKRAPLRIPKEQINSDTDNANIFESRNKKLVLDTTAKTPKDVVITADSWSFGKLFRLALIIIFILAIVWVIGSQVVQVSKNLK